MRSTQADIWSHYFLAKDGDGQRSAVAVFSATTKLLARTRYSELTKQGYFAREHLGLPLSQEGVVNSNPVGKGKGATGQVCDQNAKYATTTEAVLTTATRLLTPTGTLTFTLPLFFRSILTASRRL